MQASELHPQSRKRSSTTTSEQKLLMASCQQGRLVKNSHATIFGDGWKTRYIIRLRTLSSQPKTPSDLVEFCDAFILKTENLCHKCTSIQCYYQCQALGRVPAVTNVIPEKIPQGTFPFVRLLKWWLVHCSVHAHSPEISGRRMLVTTGISPI